MRLTLFIIIAGMFSALRAAEPDQMASRDVLRLSLKRAVEIGLSPEGNASIQLSAEEIQQAAARSTQARAALLPDVEGTVGVQSVTRNLDAMGLKADDRLAGIGIPRSVGPFNIFDARVSVTQNVLDMSSIRRYQASKVGIRVARTSHTDTQDQVASRIAHAYLGVLRAEASLEAVVENVKLAEAILKQAEALSTAGTGTGIEVTRARVLLANENQRLLVARNDNDRSHQELLRVIGMRLDTTLELTDKLSFIPETTVALQDWKAQALTSRSDLKAQQEREEQSRLTSSAAKLERAPSVQSFADYGSLGTGINGSIPTRSYGVSVKIPIFDGGRRQGRASESASKHRQEKIRTNDLREQIELQLSLAIDALNSAAKEVSVASEGLTLAERELGQARRRYGVGVADSLEVADAQARLARARDNRVVALYRHNIARIDLADAGGTIQTLIQEGKLR